MNRKHGGANAVMRWLAALALVMAVALALAGPALAEPEPGQAAQAQALTLLDQGELAAAGGHFDKAEHLWQEALRARPAWPVAQQRLAQLPARRQGYAAQVARIARDQKASLDFVEGVTLFNQGDYAGAAKIFQNVAETLPGHPFARQYLADAQAQAQAIGYGSLTVESNLPAKISLGGRAVGVTPLTLNDLPVGEHVVTAEANDAQARQTVVIRGRTTSFATFSFREIEAR